MDAIVAKGELRTHDFSSVGFRRDPESDAEAARYVGKSASTSSINDTAMTLTSDGTTYIGGSTSSAFSKAAKLFDRKYETEILVLHKLTVSGYCSALSGWGSNHYLDLRVSADGVQTPNGRPLIISGFSIPAGTTRTVDIDDTNGLQGTPLLLTGTMSGYLMVWLDAYDSIATEPKLTISAFRFSRFYFQFD